MGKQKKENIFNSKGIIKSGGYVYTLYDSSENNIIGYLENVELDAKKRDGETVVYGTFGQVIFDISYDLLMKYLRDGLVLKKIYNNKVLCKGKIYYMLTNEMVERRCGDMVFLAIDRTTSFRLEEYEGEVLDVKEEIVVT